MHDLIIIGGGPAGVAAGVYAARKRLKTLFITESFGGQSTDSMGVQNWIGTIEISGPELAKTLEAHLRAYMSDVVEIKTGLRATNITKEGDVFNVTVGKDTYQAKTVLITTGSVRRKLKVPGAKEFEHKGISYCASCDGPLFTDQDVAVVGGGNAAFETAAQLLAYAKSVTLLNRTDHFRADEATVESVSANPKMKILKNVEITEIKGEKFATGVAYKDTSMDAIGLVPANGIFVEIGLLPNTALAENILALNQIKQIPVDPKNQRTTVAGLWAAGDCTDALFHQNNIAMGDAVKALEDIYLYVHKMK